MQQTCGVFLLGFSAGCFVSGCIVLFANYVERITREECHRRYYGVLTTYPKGGHR